MVFVLLNTNMTVMIQNNQTHYITIFCCDFSVLPLSTVVQNPKYVIQNPLPVVQHR